MDYVTVNRSAKLRASEFSAVDFREQTRFFALFIVFSIDVGRKLSSEHAKRTESPIEEILRNQSGIHQSISDHKSILWMEMINVRLTICYS